MNTADWQTKVYRNNPVNYTGTLNPIGDKPIYHPIAEDWLRAIADNNRRPMKVEDGYEIYGIYITVFEKDIN